MEPSLRFLTHCGSDEPVELLRVVHSFAPCLACAVHVTRPGSSEKLAVLRAG